MTPTLVDRVLTWAFGGLLTVGFVLFVVTLIDGVVVYHQYWFLLTEQFHLAIAASIGIVAAANCWRADGLSPVFPSRSAAHC
jgi:hypothetical protein